jgi:hypothetical protein
VVHPNGDVAPVFEQKLDYDVTRYYAMPQVTASGRVASGKAWPQAAKQDLSWLPIDHYHEVYLT